MSGHWWASPAGIGPRRSTRLRDARFVNPADLCVAGAADQVRLLEQGEVSARELVDATLRRLDEPDPMLHAYRIVLAEPALDRAGELDQLPRGERGVLHGVPVAVKDDTDVAGTTTTFGTAAHGPAHDVDVVVVALPLSGPGNPPMRPPGWCRRPFARYSERAEAASSSSTTAVAVGSNRCGSWGAFSSR